MAEDVCRDLVTQGPLDRLAATLDLGTSTWQDGEVPPLGHWLFALPAARQSQLGRDGHPEKGGFLPVTAQPRRMWAGSRLTFGRPMRVGDTVERHSSVAKVEEKTAMTFVTVLHRWTVGGDATVTEEQDLVYLPERRAGDTAIARQVVAAEATSVRQTNTDEAMLMRFSALTFNAHRIHYDLPYARDVEHHPGLIVHGPLLATLLMHHALGQESVARCASFKFRARSPVICGDPFELCRNGDELWVRKGDGIVAMTAQIGWA